MAMPDAPTTGSLVTPRRRLWRYLWGWVLVSMVLVWLTLTAMAYYTGRHEADEVNDGQLVSAAELVWRQWSAPGAAVHSPVGPLSSRSTGVNSYSPELHVLVWQDGQLRWDSHAMADQLPKNLTPGYHRFSTHEAGTHKGLRHWRMYLEERTQVDTHSTWRVAVMVDTGRLKALGRDIAEHIVRPALVLLPGVAFVLAWAIRRGLQPLELLSRQVHELDIRSGDTLPEGQRFEELSGTVLAINGLVERLQQQVQRERRFASDVAHELRTPLTAMVWQARVAREAASDVERASALQQVEQDALRAGRILTQLLDLARAQGLDRSATESVDLCALASQVLVEHALRAHETRHELALVAPEGTVCVPGHSTMLTLALRNLVDNGLRHTPAGTHIEVAVQRHLDGRVTLSVSDDGQAHAAQNLSAVPLALTAGQAGLGIGLTLVQRIADWHGVTLSRDSGAAPFSNRFSLVWVD